MKKKIISLFLLFTLIITSSTPINVAASSKDIPIELAVKQKYNPQRYNSENNIKRNNMNLSDVEIDDQNVVIEKVTLLDENSNVIKEYEGQEALNYLMNSLAKQNNVSAKESFSNQSIIYHERFYQRVVESYYQTKFKNKTIKKGMSFVTSANFKNLVISIGTSFAKPVYSIIVSAIQTFLPEQVSQYKAGDVTQNVANRYYMKVVELDEKDDDEENYFTVVKLDKIITNVNSTYSTVDKDTGELTTFKTHLGDVQVEYGYMYKDSDYKLAKYALNNWYTYPYVYDYRIKYYPKRTNVELLEYEEETVIYVD